MEAIRPVAESEAFAPLPPLPDELYESFFKTGQRLPFEKVYFERRRRLGRLAMTVLLGDAATREKFTGALIEKIGEIMAEESWTLPAHAWTQPSGKDPFKIDLFAAETANTMGELLNLFAGILPKELQTQVKVRLREQIFENYLHPRSEITWKQLPMNWNAVCHQGVIGAALAVEDDLDLVAEILASAAECLEIFLSGFGKDGSTSEGPGYWCYGFGRFAELNCQLETATGGTLTFIGNNEHIRRIAQFAPALVFSNGNLVNFSDGHRKGRLELALLAYLGKRLDLPLLKQESAALYRAAMEDGIDLNMQRADVFYFTRLFLRCPANLEAVEEPARIDTFFPDYGAVIAHGENDRGALLEFAAKGGHNAEHHNHNDCGSYILNLNGEPGIIEIGSPEYVNTYFSSDATRYSFLAARSLGHSVPLVNGYEQAVGAEFAARVIECQLENDRIKFEIDLTQCYPIEAGCRSLVRTFIFEKKPGRLVISDAFRFETAGEVKSIIICDAPAKYDESGVRIETEGGTLLVTPQGDGRYEGVERCSYKTHQGRDGAVNRLSFKLDRPLQSGVIICDIHVL
jgi:hypothetical protein